MNTPLQILIVEDSENDAKLVARHIEQAGYQVRWERVEDATALQAAVEQKSWDVILCDYSLPGFSGMNALAMVRASGQDLPVILVSGKMGEDVAVEAMRSGANDYVMKDNLKRLVPAIERELREAGSRRELRAAETALRQLTIAVESAANAIIITDRRGVILWTNPAFTELSGRPAEEVRGQNPQLLKSGEHEPAFYRNLWETILAGEVWRGEVINRHKHGHLYTIEQNITPVRDRAGRISQFVSIARDITERKRAEETLQVSAARYKSIIAVSNTGAWEYHRDTDYLWCSPEYFSMLGYNIAGFEMSGKANLKETWIDLLHPEDRVRAANHFAEYLKNGSIGMYENYFRLSHKNGSWVWIWSRGQTLRPRMVS